MTEVQVSIRNTIVFDTRDWSLNATDAWLYGIVVGWGVALSEVADLHNWDTKTVERLTRLNHDWMKA